MELNGLSGADVPLRNCSLITQFQPTKVIARPGSR